jgi:hypothetical protein
VDEIATEPVLAPSLERARIATLSGLKTLLETGELLETPGSRMYSEPVGDQVA